MLGKLFSANMVRSDKEKTETRMNLFFSQESRAIQALKANEYLNLVVKWLQTECMLFFKGNFADAQPA